MTKKTIELRLIPAPGSKPEFLATLAPPSSSSTPPAIWSKMTSTSSQHPVVVVLEGYTRDDWASDTSTQWNSLQVQSVDGRQKLPGFTKYLRERQKTAFGRVNCSSITYVWVISYKQASSQTLKCRIAQLDAIPKCPLKPLQQKQKQQPPPVQQQKQMKSSSQTKTNSTNTAAAAPKRKKGFGLLGNLVGAQKRTNDAVQSVTAPPVSSSSGGGGTSSDGAGGGSGMGGAVGQQGGESEVEIKTPAQVLAEFRREMEEKFLDFDIAPDPVLKVQITLGPKIKHLAPADQPKVTMELLKYIVYEQAEEINEEWVAFKEPTEFLDEITISIYKEGEAPPEVLEEINKGDLPDEIRGQQRAIQEQRQRAEQAKEQKKAEELRKAALARGGQGDDDDDDFAVLNQNKRDRRTIEEIQRGVGVNNNKRARVD